MCVFHWAIPVLHVGYLYIITHEKGVFIHRPTQSLPCHTASGDNCTSGICPNTVVTYTCTITSGTAAGLTDWTLPTGTCPTNAFPDKIRLSQFVSGACVAQVTSTCEPYRASSIQSSDPIYCLSSILAVNITAAIGSFVRNFHIGFDPAMNIIKNTRPFCNKTPDDRIV